MSEVEVNRATVLAGLPHGFLGRRGGVSTGDLAGLNVGYGSKDDKDAIGENRERAIAAVQPGADLVTVHQIHSPRVVIAERAWPIDARPNADAMVSVTPGLLLGILTADCAPILLADAEAGVIGAAHAGWRGAFAGVAEATVEAMEKLGAKRRRIVAAIGPCIAQGSYEVDAGFRANFIGEDAANDRFFTLGPSGKPHFDLEAYVARRLADCGVGQVEALHLDTYADPDRFYSYRRATHRGEADYGRQASLIALP
jgi:YfiH family protein